uniref:Movement protein n=1 Tax=Mesocestoides corti TaxID=53468 RepID=A0A5K3G2Z2_MESCO
GSGTFCHSRKGHGSFTKTHRDAISSQEDYPPLQENEARYSSSHRRDNGRQGRKRLGNANISNYQPDGHNTLPTERKGRAVASNSEIPVDGQDRRGRGGTLQINRRNQRQHFVARRGRGGAPLHSDRKHDGRDEDRDLVRKGRGLDVPSNPNNNRHAGDVRRVQFSSNRGNTNEGVDTGTSHRRSTEESEHL